MDDIALFDIKPPTAPAPVSRTSSQGRELFKMDGWQNIKKHIGTSRDSRTSSRFLADALLDKQSLGDIYTNDGLVAKIIDSIPDDMMRPWGTIENDPDDKYNEGLINHELRRIEAPRYLAEAKKYARLMGGALLYVGITDSGMVDKPIEYRPNSKIEFLQVFDLGDIETWDCEFQEDMNKPDFGKIVVYAVKVRVGNKFYRQRIHADRCIPFYGKRVPKSTAVGQLLETRYWGVSALQGMYADIMDYRLSFANTAGIISEFMVSKLKITDLDDILASGNEKAFMSRIAGIEMTKSLINAVMIGADEDYIRDSASVAGLADLLDRFMMQVSAVSYIPVTKLFGRSASGLNATGEGDQKSYYDALDSERQALTPEIERLIKIVAQLNGLKDDDYSWKWGNLVQLTSEQIANEERIKAETLRTNQDAVQRAIQDGVMHPEDAYNMFWKEKNDGKAWVEPEPMEPTLEEDMINAIQSNGTNSPDKSEISNSPTPDQL